MNQLLGGNECERTHTITTTTTGSKNSQKKPTIRQAIRTVFCAPPPQGPSLTACWSWMKSSARNTLSNQQAQPKEAETVNLTENAPRGSLADCQEDVPYTALTIV